MIFSLTLLDRQIVDAGNAQTHQPVLVEFPVLVAIAAKPAAAIIMPLIGKTHCNTGPMKGPDFLDQAVIEFSGPFASQEGFDGLATLEELGAVPPAAIGGIAERNMGWIARVPCILGQARFLGGSLRSKGRK